MISRVWKLLILVKLGLGMSRLFSGVKKLVLLWLFSRVCGLRFSVCVWFRLVGVSRVLVCGLMLLMLLVLVVRL